MYFSNFPDSHWFRLISKWYENHSAGFLNPSVHYVWLDLTGFTMMNYTNQASFKSPAINFHAIRKWMETNGFLQQWVAGVATQVWVVTRWLTGWKSRKTYLCYTHIYACNSFLIHFSTFTSKKVGNPQPAWHVKKIWNTPYLYLSQISVFVIKRVYNRASW